MRDRPFFSAEMCEKEVVDDRAQVPKGAVSQVREFFAQHDTVPAHKSNDPQRPPTPPTIDVAMAAPTTDVLSQQPTTPRRSGMLPVALTPSPTSSRATSMGQSPSQLGLDAMTIGTPPRNTSVRTSVPHVMKEAGRRLKSIIKFDDPDDEPPPGSDDMLRPLSQNEMVAWCEATAFMRPQGYR